MNGAVLSAWLLDLSNFEQVFARLTPSFIHEHLRSEPDELEMIARYAAAALDQALKNGEKTVGNIHSIHQLLRVASRP